MTRIIGLARRGLVCACGVAAAIAATAVALPATSSAAQVAPVCPDAVIPGVAVVPNAAGCWNAIAVRTVRLATPFQNQGLVYVGYTQAAVYER
jgi:hypothetical protein